MQEQAFPGSGVAWGLAQPSAVLNLWLCVEAMAEHELINPILQMGKPRLGGGQWLGLGCELGFAIRPSPNKAAPLPDGSCGPASWGMFFSVLLSHSAACFPCRDRELRAYCVLPCARHVVCLLEFSPHDHLGR